MFSGIRLLVPPRNLFRSHSLQCFPFSSGVKPFSRRKNNTSQPIRIFNFQIEATKFIESVRLAVGPMQEVNKEMNIISEPDKLIIEVGVKGMYTIEADYDVKRIIGQTPISGRLEYYYKEDADAWVGEKDDHDLRGLITRDMMRQQLIGCPAF